MVVVDMVRLRPLIPFSTNSLTDISFPQVSVLLKYLTGKPAPPYFLYTQTNTNTASVP
jgi:hypothetical protein